MVKILIVDDLEQNLYLLKNLLTGYGYDVVDARNGVEALELARRDPPDIIISDIMMPMMDGFSLCRECKRDGHLKDVPFVFYTATYTDPKDEELARKLGAARFIVKPVEVEEFISTLRDVLREYEAGRLAAPEQPLEEEETVYYRLYNEVLIHKLEDKVFELRQEMAERKRVEEQLQRAASAGNVGLWDWDLRTSRVYYSPEWKRQIGHADHEIGDGFDEWQNRLHPDDLDRCLQTVQAYLANPWPNYQLEFRFRHKDGSYRWILAQASLLFDEQGKPARMLGSHVDITERKQLEAEKEALATQYHQAQKMDSIGQLAGGIAHDFSNLLVPIIGYAELGLLKLTPDSQLYSDLGRIIAAGERAAGLTRQILAFSRQQVLEIKSLDLNQVVSEFETMLHRLIGENIALQTRLAPNLPPIKADKGQIEQVLLNLAVNARDAMPDGGALIIETAHVVLDEAYVAKHAGVRPGPHVLLAVSDTGRGMDAATQQRIFEPFFTTKARGQGTGLGLATVFGIVKQHGGNIWVYSEPGRGSTFKVYLPLAEAPISTAEPARPAADSLRGTETVLIVEGEAGVRQLVCETLQAYGYQVLEAGEPEKGLALAAAYEGSIHLLLTDVIMPHMNGRMLYQQLASERAGLKVLYMSGYTDNVIAHHHVLDGETALLQKPFTIQGLLQKVRAVLG